MIQVGTYLNVIDNSGARQVCCIKVSKGYKKRYSNFGDIITVSIKSIRRNRAKTAKVKKGEVYKALIVRTKSLLLNNFSNSITFNENSVVLLNKQKKLIGTRIFGGLPRQLKSTRFLRLVSVSAGVL